METSKEDKDKMLKVLTTPPMSGGRNAEKCTKSYNVYMKRERLWVKTKKEYMKFEEFCVCQQRAIEYL